MKLQTFITNNKTKIEEFQQDYIDNNVEALKKPLQEFFGTLQSIISLMKEYDLVDIEYNELTAELTADAYTSDFDKQRDEVEKLSCQAEKYLLEKDIERNKKVLTNLIATINIAKGV